MKDAIEMRIKHDSAWQHDGRTRLRKILKDPLIGSLNDNR